MKTLIAAITLSALLAGPALADNKNANQGMMGGGMGMQGGGMMQGKGMGMMGGGMMMGMMSPEQMQQMQERMQSMQQLMNQIRDEKNGQKRQQMLHQHMMDMQQGMHMMYGAQNQNQNMSTEDRLKVMEQHMAIMQAMMGQMMDHTMEMNQGAMMGPKKSK